MPPLNPSNARQAIYDQLAMAEGPLTAIQIRMAFKKKIRPGIATVYRAVGAGIRDGLLKEVALGNGAMRYEPADRGHHHHFACTACDRVIDIPGCPGSLDGLVPDGCRLTGHDITLRGLCESCTKGSVPQ
ncbi:MAG: transcriptional repressor [Algisphaera sp.]